MGWCAVYTSLRIQNFRCFEDLHLNDLARINLIAGKNNTGKTSLLEAISILAGYVEGDVFFRYLKLTDWKLIFYQLDLSLQPTIAGKFLKDEDELTYRVEMGTPETYKKKEPSRYFNPRFSVAFYIGTSEEPYVFDYRSGSVPVIDTSFSPPFPMVRLSAHQPVALEDSARRFSKMPKPFRQDVLLPALRVLEPRLVDLELHYENDPPIVYGYVGLPEAIPLALMGEGIDRIASLVLAIGSASGGVVLIDEIENGLHYSVLTDVWKAIALAAREFDVQIFATTHSLEMISAAHRAFSEETVYDFRLHRLDRKPTGEISSVTFDQEHLETAEEMNLEVR